MGPKYQLLSTDEKELLAILFAVKKVTTLLLRSTFNYKNRQKALKHLFEQPRTTLLQNWGLEKLMGLNFSIEYEKGKDNIVADALSRNEGNGTLATLLILTS